MRFNKKRTLLLYYLSTKEQDKRKGELIMGILETIQVVSGILADIGDFTFQGMNIYIYLLARRIEKKDKNEKEKNPVE